MPMPVKLQPIKFVTPKLSEEAQWSIDDDVYEAGTTSCCGISELDLNELINIYDAFKKKDNPFHLVNADIKHQLRGVKDKRLVLCSVLQNKNYEWMIPHLKKLGFRQLGEPYKNENSGNVVIPFAARMP